MESNCCGTIAKSGILWAQNKDFSMNIGLKSKIVGSALTIATVFGGVAANSNQAYAKTPFDSDIELFTDVANPGDGGKDDPAPKKTEPKPSRGLEFKNLSKASFVDARGSAGAISREKDGLVILYCGNTREVGDRIKNVLEQLQAEGYKVIGAVKTHTDLAAANGQECFATMIKGTKFGDYYTDLSEKKIRLEIIGCLTTMGYQVAMTTPPPSNDLVVK
ncbi:MAG: hypothetical protein K8F30_05715 [Taibaiella sp.]|nr:hypothetical protein [Taibaiella sp.]